MSNNDLSLIITLFIINIILYFITISWISIRKKEHCKCILNFKLLFIKYFMVFMIAFVFICMIHHDVISDWVLYLLFVFEIMYITVVFLYIRDLIKIHDFNCTCELTCEHDIKPIDVMIVSLSFVLFVVIFIERSFHGCSNGFC